MEDTYATKMIPITKEKMKSAESIMVEIGKNNESTQRSKPVQKSKQKPHSSHATLPTKPPQAKRNIQIQKNTSKDKSEIDFQTQLHHQHQGIVLLSFC